jgi:hypothetical protein
MKIREIARLLELTDAAQNFKYFMTKVIISVIEVHFAFSKSKKTAIINWNLFFIKNILFIVSILSFLLSVYLSTKIQA